MPRLSVVVPTVHPWPRVRTLLDRVRDQARRTGAEVLVADGSGSPLPAGWDEEPFVHLPVPGGDVFTLRAAAWAAARGDVVALLEDHILVPADWCDRVVRAFAEHPEADGIVGTVDNGAPALLDRASFYVTWAPFLAPLPSLPADRCPPPGVVAYRRGVLPTGAVDVGLLEYDLPVRLRAEGRLRVVDDLTVTHIQYLGSRAFTIQYHAGRAFAAVECAGLGPAERVRRLRVLGRNPERVLRQTNAAFRSRPATRETVAVRAAIVGMIACNGAGQVVGALTGTPGSSPRHLE